MFGKCKNYEKDTTKHCQCHRHGVSGPCRLLYDSAWLYGEENRMENHILGCLSLKVMYLGNCVGLWNFEIVTPVSWYGDYAPSLYLKKKKYDAACMMRHDVSF